MRPGIFVSTNPVISLTQSRRVRVICGPFRIPVSGGCGRASNLPGANIRGPLPASLTGPTPHASAGCRCDEPRIEPGVRIALPGPDRLGRSLGCSHVRGERGPSKSQTRRCHRCVDAPRVLRERGHFTTRRSRVRQERGEPNPQTTTSGHRCVYAPRVLRERGYFTSLVAGAIVHHLFPG